MPIAGEEEAIAYFHARPIDQKNGDGMKMVSVDVNQLSGPALNWAVALCLGYDELDIWHTGAITSRANNGIVTTHCYDSFLMAGSIIEQEGIATRRHSQSGRWYAMSQADIGDGVSPSWAEFTAHGGERYGVYSYQVHKRRQRFDGDSLLEAAMRCFVASKKGSSIEVPIEALVVAGACRECYG